MTYRLLALLISVLLFSACASQSQKKDDAEPSWILGESEKYASKQYLLGVGEADTLADAKSRARAEIAKVFNVNIAVESRDKTRFESATQNGAATSSGALSVEREIYAKTNQRLQGVEIAEVWKNNNTQRYYALASLSRIKTAMALRSDIEQLDAATLVHHEAFHATSSRFKKIRRLNQGIALQTQRLALNKQLRVVSALGNGVEVKWPLARLEGKLATLLESISINARAEGPYAEQLQVALANTLGNYGFNVIPNGEYTLNVNLNTTPLPEHNGWYYQKATMSVSLKGKKNASLGGHEWQFKVSSTQQSLSDARVLEKAKQYLKNELNEKIMAFMGED